MQSVTREEIEDSFAGGSEEELYVPKLDDIDWQAQDFLGWVHPGGHRGYLVHWSPLDGELKGTVLRRSRWVGKKPRLEMCAWCHHVHDNGGTAMFSVSLRGSGGRHLFGNVVCANLDCSLRIRNLIGAAPWASETIYLPARIWRMQRKMHKWLRKADRL